MTILIRLLLLLAQTKLGSECDLKKQLLLLLHVFKRSSLIIYTKMHNSLTYLLTTHKYNWLYIYYVVIHQHLFASCTCIFTHYYTNGLLSRLPTPFLSRFWNRDKASGTKASRLLSRVAEPGQKVLDVKKNFAHHGIRSQDLLPSTWFPYQLT